MRTGLRAVAAPRAAFGNLEHALLGLVDQVARRHAVVAEHRGGNGAAHADQRAQQGALAHDLRIGTHVGSSGRVTRQCGQVGQSTGILQLASIQLFRHGDHVADLGLRRQFGNGFEYQPVVGTIEILGAHGVADLVPRGGIEQQAAKDSLLCFH